MDFLDKEKEKLRKFLACKVIFIFLVYYLGKGTEYEMEELMWEIRKKSNL